MSRKLLINEPDVGKKFTHHGLAEVARGIAAEFWEQMCTGTKLNGRIHPNTAKSTAAFRASWPDQQAFVDAKWHEFINTARSSLAMLLGRKDIADAVKADISEILRLDSLVNPRKVHPLAKAADPLPRQFHPKR